MTADDPIAAELDPIRERSAAFLDPAIMDLYRAGCAHKSAEDVPRLLAALDAVLTLHRPVLNVMYEGDRCTECRDSYGDPVPFEQCRVRAAVLSALKGESNAEG